MWRLIPVPADSALNDLTFLTVDPINKSRSPKCAKNSKVITIKFFNVVQHFPAYLHRHVVVYTAKLNIQYFSVITTSSWILINCIWICNSSMQSTGFVCILTTEIITEIFPGSCFHNKTATPTEPVNGIAPFQRVRFPVVCNFLHPFLLCYTYIHIHATRNPRVFLFVQRRKYPRQKKNWLFQEAKKIFVSMRPRSDEKVIGELEWKGCGALLELFIKAERKTS